MNKKYLRFVNRAAGTQEIIEMTTPLPNNYRNLLSHGNFDGIFDTYEDASWGNPATLQSELRAEPMPGLTGSELRAEPMPGLTGDEYN